jgi:hypothetical protein
MTFIDISTYSYVHFTIIKVNLFGTAGLESKVFIRVLEHLKTMKHADEVQHGGEPNMSLPNNYVAYTANAVHPN